jgi:transcriptional regulator with XRE-family HTH domain
MTARIRPLGVADRRADKQRREIGAEFHERRLQLGLSQAALAEAAGSTRNRCALVEAGRLPTVGLMELNRVAGALGLELFVRAYPGGAAIRDVAHTGKLAAILADVRRPLTCRVEVPLPANSARWERRAWDAVVFGHGERTAIELEMRLRDVQELRRRHGLKRRDDPAEHFLLLVADTRHNRRTIAEFAELFEDLPRLRPSSVRAALGAGRHPPTGLLLV